MRIPLFSVLVLGMLATFVLGSDPENARTPYRNEDRQTQPIRVSKRHFDIPFQLQSVENVAAVELLVSRDFGTTWTAQAKTAPREGKFSFQAPGNGEYWFSFRTIATDEPSGGRQKPTPHLRILVEAEESRKTSNSAAPDLTMPPKPLRAGKRHIDIHSGEETGSDTPIEAGSLPESTASSVLRDLNPSRTRSMPQKAAQNTLESMPQQNTVNEVATLPLETLMADIGQIYASNAVSSESPEPSHTEPSQTEPSHTEPSHTEPPPPMKIFLPQPKQETQWQTTGATAGQNDTTDDTQTPETELPPLVFEPEDPRVPEEENTTDFSKAAKASGNVSESPEIPVSEEAATSVSEAGIETKTMESATSPSPPGKAKSPPLPGRITKVELQGEKWQKRVVVKWAVKMPQPFEPPEETPLRVDVLRGPGPEGPWAPIVVGMENSGEYWWAVSEADLQPFFIAVRCQAADGRFTFDTTRRAILIHSEMLGN